MSHTTDLGGGWVAIHDGDWSGPTVLRQVVGGPAGEIVQECTLSAPVLAALRAAVKGEPATVYRVPALPINPADDEIVERLFAERTSQAPFRPIHPGPATWQAERAALWRFVRAADRYAYERTRAGVGGDAPADRAAARREYDAARAALSPEPEPR